MYFTDSPYERLMTEPTEIRPEAEDLPPGHPCRGCEYLQNGTCGGICWWELLETNVVKAKGK